MINNNFPNFRVAPINNFADGIIQGRYSSAGDFYNTVLSLHYCYPVERANSMAGGLIPNLPTYKSFAPFEREENIHLVPVSRKEMIAEEAIKKTLANLQHYGLKPCVHPANYLLGLYAQFAKRQNMPKELSDMFCVAVIAANPNDQSVVRRGKKAYLAVEQSRSQGGPRLEVYYQDQIGFGNEMVIIAREIKNSIYINTGYEDTDYRHQF